MKGRQSKSESIVDQLSSAMPGYVWAPKWPRHLGMWGAIKVPLFSFAVIHCLFFRILQHAAQGREETEKNLPLQSLHSKKENRQESMLFLKKNKIFQEVISTLKN